MNMLKDPQLPYNWNSLMMLVRTERIMIMILFISYVNDIVKCENINLDTANFISSRRRT